MTDSATRISSAGTVTACRWTATPHIIAATKADRERRAGAMRGGKTADRDHRGEMVDADDRMAEPGQDALAEGRRHSAAHQVMRECGLGQQRPARLRSASRSMGVSWVLLRLAASLAVPRAA